MTSVMVAEDNDIIREHICRTVSSFEGFSAGQSVSSGTEAVRTFKSDPADLVLMDIEMEDARAGLDAAREILSFSPEAKIVFLTSHDDDEMIITAMATGAKDFIAKDSPAAVLNDHLKAVRDGKPVMEDRVQNLVMKEYKRLSDSEQSLLYFIRHLSSLTKSEKELVGCFLSGMKTREIAARRCVEVVTVKSQVRTLLQKFGLSRTSEMVAKIRELKIGHLFQ